MSKKKQRRFIQAKDTPLTVEYMIDELELLDIGEAADEILKGNYVASQWVDPTLQIVLDNLRCPDVTIISRQHVPIICKEY